jgi:DNA-binding response OmpR family regulator
VRILLIEDDAMIGRNLVRGLENQGMAVDWVRSGVDGHAVLGAGRQEHTLVLLDLGLPGMSGLDVLKDARQKRKALPILVITAKDGVEDRIAGLDLGADDYIVKPFDLDEVMARMRSVLRRAAGRGDPVIEHGDLRVDPVTHTVERHGVPISLSAHEFSVLEALLQRPGSVLSRAQLEDRLYGWDDQIGSNAVEVYVHGLRRKLGSDVIRTLRGVGYFVPKL